MKLKLLLSALILLLMTSLNTNAQTPLVGVSPFGANLDVIDTATMAVATSIPMTSTTGAVDGANGLSADACGTIYIVYKVVGSRYLGTIDPTTGVITEIGLFADNISNITFVNGVLYGVTGDGASTPETLYTINITTAAMTLAATLGNGNDGEAICFNPDDGLIYHWSGWGSASIIMETINPVTFAISPVTVSGATLNNVGAAVYAGNDLFIVGDVFDGAVKYVTSSGAVSTTTNTSTYKGLAFVQAGGGTASVTNTTAANDSICAGETAVLVCNNTGVTYEWFLDGTSTGNTNDTLNATVAGAYVCEIDNGTCVLASDTINLTVSNLPTTNITPSPSATICDGDTLELTLNTGGGPAGFQWYLDGAIIPGATNSNYFATVAGSYNATKTNQNGCTDSSAIATVITVNPAPTVNITPTPSADICAGDSVELTVNAGGGGGTIQWSLNGTDIVGATSASYFANTAGSYNVTKTNMNGCSAESTTPTVLNVNSLPAVSLTPSGTVNYCAGDSIEISITSGGSGGVFQWYLNGSAISGATNSSYFASSEGSYNLVKTNANGCSDSAAVATMLVDTCSNSLIELSVLSIELYPNPTSGFISVEFNSFSGSDVSGVQLVGLDGKAIRIFNIHEADANSISLDVSDIKSGVYFVRLSTAFGEIVKEIIIE